MHWIMKRTAFGFAIIAALVFTEIKVHGNSPDTVRKANWQLADKWHPARTAGRIMSLDVEPHWIQGTETFWYRYKTTEGISYWRVDPISKGKKILFDRAKLSAALTQMTRKPLDRQSLDLKDLTFAKDGRVMRFRADDASYEYELATGTLSLAKPEEKPKKEPWQNISPDGSLCVFMRGSNLYIMNPSDPKKKETQLTFDGKKDLDWVGGWGPQKANEKGNRFVSVNWSPDSRKFCVLRSDQRDVKDLWLVDHLAKPRPALKTYKCPMPGEKVPPWELWIYDADAKKMIRVDAKRWDSQTLQDLFIPNQWWSKDSKNLYFTRRSRDYFMVDVCAADSTTGKSRVIIEERLQGQIYIHPLVELPETQELLWWSMRDGFGHYYLYGKDGRLKNQITRGSFNAEEVVSVDKESRVLYFTGNGREEGRNPYYIHLYRANLDGTDLRLLTPEDAEHKVSFSPSKMFFVDNYSRVDLPVRAVLRDRKGTKVLDLEAADVSLLLAAGWQPPTIFKAKSADRVTDQWGVMYKPFDLDPNRKYPIVTRVYPGRQNEFIPKAFQPSGVDIFFAQLGFIVVVFGNRGGCPHRGLAYREYAREEFRDYGLPDKKYVIEQLADRFSYIDLDRVGMYGGSSGGFMTVSAMLVYPDFFKVGVGMSGPNDPSIYYNIWAERYYGVKKITEKSGAVRWESKPEGNIELAKNLKGRLLMIYGSQDNNVHPAHLFRMADAFIKAGKCFDMFVVPGTSHGLGDWRYRYTLVCDYFVEHLLGDRRDSVEILIGRLK